eukprot:gene167-4413_t
MLFSNSFFLEFIPEYIEYELIEDKNIKVLFQLFEQSLYEGSQPLYVHPNQLYIFKSKRKEKIKKIKFNQVYNYYLGALKNYLTFQFKDKKKIKNFVCFNEMDLLGFELYPYIFENESIRCYVFISKKRLKQMKKNYFVLTPIGITGIKRKNTNYIEINNLKFNFEDYFKHPKIFKSTLIKKKERKLMSIDQINKVSTMTNTTTTTTTTNIQQHQNILNNKIKPKINKLKSSSNKEIEKIKIIEKKEQDEDDLVLDDLENEDLEEELFGFYKEEKEEVKMIEQEMKEQQVEVLEEEEEEEEEKKEEKKEIEFKRFEKKYEIIDFSNHLNISYENSIPYFNNEEYFLKENKKEKKFEEWKPKNELKVIEKKRKKEKNIFSKEISFYENIIKNENEMKEKLILFLIKNDDCLKSCDLNNIEQNENKISNGDIDIGNGGIDNDNIKQTNQINNENEIKFKDIYIIFEYVMNKLTFSLPLKFEMDLFKPLDIPSIRFGFGEFNWMDTRPDIIKDWNTFGLTTFGKPKNIFLNLIFKEKEMNSNLKLFLKELQSLFQIYKMGNLNYYNLIFLDLDSKDMKNKYTKESIEDLIKFENEKKENCNLILDFTNTFFSTKYSTKCSILYFNKQEENISDLIFNIYNNSIRNEFKDSIFYYEPCFCLTEKQNIINTLHCSYFIIKKSTNQFELIISFIDSFGEFFKILYFQNINSFLDCLNEIFNNCLKLKDKWINIIICKFNQICEKEEINFWLKKNILFFSLKDNSNIQFFIDHTKKGNRHSFLIQNEYYYILKMNGMMNLIIF